MIIENAISDLLAILQIHRGKAGAITGKELAQVMGEQNDRLIRKEIRDLIADGFPIASSTEKPYGYFMAETPQEVEQYLKQLKGRLVEDAYRRRDFKKAARTLNKEKQLALM
jgi:predicted DNA-binding transcriptional regulator YafY